jgi:hypothetical protein|eukprot:COSAG06_NODE_416_length_15996_cov_260.778637_17_plen_693_part_00
MEPEPEPDPELSSQPQPEPEPEPEPRIVLRPPPRISLSPAVTGGSRSTLPPYEPWALRRQPRSGLLDRDGFGTIGPGPAFPPPENTPRIIQQRRSVLLGNAGFPWTLVTGVTVTLVSLVLVFRYQPLIDFFRDYEVLLWTIKFVLIMMLAILLVRFKHRNAYDEHTRMSLGYPMGFAPARLGGMRVDGSGLSAASRQANSEAAILRELHTLTALNQQIGARQQMRDAMQDRRRLAVEAREERKRQQKREQASQLVASLPRINMPNCVPCSSRPSSSASNASGAGGSAGPGSVAEWAQRNRPEDCSICLGRLEEEECTRLSCGHMYHHSCIESWLVDGTGRTLRCPLCNLVLLDEPEPNTSEEEDMIEDELDEMGAGLDAALAAEWLVTAAQHAFIMQMARGDDLNFSGGGGGGGGPGSTNRAALGAGTTIDEALDALEAQERRGFGDEMRTESDEDDDDDDDEPPGAQLVPREARIRRQLPAQQPPPREETVAPRGDDYDLDDTIRRFVEEEAERYVQAEARLMAMADVEANAAGVQGPLPAPPAGGRRRSGDGGGVYDDSLFAEDEREPLGDGLQDAPHPLRPVEPGPRVRREIELPEEAQRALEALAAADRAVEIETQNEVWSQRNRERAAAARAAARLEDASDPAADGDAAAETAPGDSTPAVPPYVSSPSGQQRGPGGGADADRTHFV